jgi:hypothetical protein
VLVDLDHHQRAVILIGAHHGYRHGIVPAENHGNGAAIQDRFHRVGGAIDAPANVQRIERHVSASTFCKKATMAWLQAWGCSIMI